MSKIELISVHVPKCAGVSLGRVFEHAYGSDAILLDYADRPADPFSPMNLDPEGFFERCASHGSIALAGKRVIHGHFNIRKYEHVPARCRITFLREPIDRTISHYFFWQTWPRHGHALQDYVLDNRLRIDEFARLPSIAGFYGGVIFAGVDMQQFNFVGFHDRLADDYCALRALLSIEHPIPCENANTTSDYRTQRDQVLCDGRLMGLLRDALKNDIGFYERVRSRWERSNPTDLGPGLNVIRPTDV